MKKTFLSVFIPFFVLFLLNAIFLFNNPEKETIYGAGLLGIKRYGLFLLIFSLIVFVTKIGLSNLFSKKDK